MEGNGALDYAAVIVYNGQTMMTIAVQPMRQTLRAAWLPELPISRHRAATPSSQFKAPGRSLPGHGGRQGASRSLQTSPEGFLFSSLLACLANDPRLHLWLWCGF